MKKPKIALVLGAGAAKGLAHIGLLKVFEKHNIKFDMIVGCSMGAIVGGLYSAGVSLEYMEHFVKRVRQLQLLDIRFINSSHGLIKGEKAERIMRRALSDNHAAVIFEDCKIPFYCVAADLVTGKQVELKTGDLAEGIRASFSVAGAFRPVIRGDQYLVDGGIISRVPVDFARRLGADYIVAVDCMGKTEPVAVEELEKYSLADTITRVFSIMDYGFSKFEIERADYVIQLDQDDVSALKIKHAEQAIKNGENIARKNLTKLKAFLNECQKLQK